MPLGLVLGSILGSTWEAKSHRKSFQLWIHKLVPKTGWSRPGVGTPTVGNGCWEANFAPGADSGAGAGVNAVY